MGTFGTIHFLHQVWLMMQEVSDIELFSGRLLLLLMMMPVGHVAQFRSNSMPWFFFQASQSDIIKGKMEFQFCFRNEMIKRRKRGREAIMTWNTIFVLQDFKSRRKLQYKKDYEDDWKKSFHFWEECHTILVWKEKWEEIRQKSVKDWKINEAENPMVWMQEISLLCHLCSKPFFDEQALFPVPVSHLLFPSCDFGDENQVSLSNSDLFKKEIVDDACIKHAYEWWYTSSWISHRAAKKPSLEFYCLLPVMFWFLFFTKFYPWFFPSIFARKCVLVSSDLNCTVNGSTNDVQKTLKHKVLRVWVQGTCTSRLILRYITKKCVVVALIFISYGPSIFCN